MDKFNRVFLFFIPFFLPLCLYAQSKDSSHLQNPIQVIKALRPPEPDNKNILGNGTMVSGKVVDSISGKVLPFVSIRFLGSTIGTNSLEDGSFQIKDPQGKYTELELSLLGYRNIVVRVVLGKNQILNFRMETSHKTLQGVTIRSEKKKKYRNKNNPAVSLIQQIIDHKDQNKMQSQDFLQYDQYERIEFSIFNLSSKFLSSNSFKKYNFLLDTTKIIGDEKKTTLPVYMGEKKFSNFLRRDPEKMIRILKAHREVNFSNFVDTAGLDIYLNRLYGSADIYENNIFILTNQFLSPIADHAPNFYKYFITDTLETGGEKLLEVSYFPRNNQSLLFEGKLYITNDGFYAVKSIDLNIGKRLNLNFVRSLHIRQDFEKHTDKHYYLKSSKVQSDFGLLKTRGFGILGERITAFQNYKAHIALPENFYKGAGIQMAPNSGNSNSEFWERERVDTLPKAQANIYHNLDSLQSMTSFKRFVGITTFITGGYGVFGPIQIKPLDATYSFNSLEGSRVTLGGRTTPAVSKRFYFEDFLAYGFKDKRFKYFSSIVFSFNQVAPYKYPNNYFKISYQSDTDIPGQNFLIDKTQSLLRSFSRGTSNFWEYNQFLRLGYVREWSNHVSINLELKIGSIQPADSLVFKPESPLVLPVQDFRSGELSLGFRYAPHEQIFQGANRRRSIPSKFPILTVRLNYGLKGLYKNPYSYLNSSASVYKRLYLSQLGYSDITFQGGVILGKVPFPLLEIIPGNQTYVLDKNEFNSMNFLEFVSDHYIGLNISQNFGGFFLNKIPLLQKLHFREFLTLKIIQGGVSDRNNPNLHPDLYTFPVNSEGKAITFPLGDTPFIEGSIGIGNIFKVLRLDLIERFNYLNNPGVSRFGLRFNFTPDL